MEGIGKVQGKFEEVCGLMGEKRKRLADLQRSINVINNMLIRPV